jgi:hypothetical protein
MMEAIERMIARMEWGLTTNPDTNRCALPLRNIHLFPFAVGLVGILH